METDCEEQQVRSYTNVQTWCVYVCVCVQGQEPRQARCVFATAHIQSPALIIWQGEMPSIHQDTLVHSNHHHGDCWKAHNNDDGFYAKRIM